MGVGLSRDGRVTALRSPQAPLANGGVYWFRPRSLHGFAPVPGQALSLENDVFPQLVAMGQRFAGLECTGAFIDIGVPDDYHRAATVLPHAPHLTDDTHALAD
jgi:D-glycero-alpha-D-manno-heptose 1-phosphate guanylyltransferase